jgi:hypothetical protein
VWLLGIAFYWVLWVAERAWFVVDIEVLFIFKTATKFTGLAVMFHLW